MRWNGVSYEIPALTEVESVLSALARLMSELERLSSASTALMKIISAFRADFDIRTLAIQSAIDAASLTLQDLIQPAAGHALLIPPIPPFERAPAAPVIPVRGFGDAAYALLLDKTGLPELLGDGGNYGVYRKFVESLFDKGDYSRPAFSNDAYVAGGILLIGAPNYLSVLRAILNLSRFLGDIFPTPLDRYQMPVPQNVKAKPIAVPRAVALGTEDVLDIAGFAVPQSPTVRTLIMQAPRPPDEYAVRLSWDPTPVVQFDLKFSSAGPISYRILATHIFVNQNGRIEKADDLSLREVSKINTPGVSSTSASVASLQTAVALSVPVSSIIVRGFDPTADYYFSVGYTVEMRLGKDVEVFEPTFETLSAQVRVNLSQQAPYKKFVEGRIPDWVAINSPLAAIPEVQDVIAEVQALIDAVSATYAGYRNEASELIGLAESALGAISRKLDELAALVGSLASRRDALVSSNVGAYASVFSGQGGVPYLMKTVGTLLLDRSVENRPPFDVGDEPVAALIFVAGSDTLAGISAFKESLEVLLGPSSQGGFSVIESINRVPSPSSSPASASEVAGFGLGPADENDTTPVRDLGIQGPEDDPC